MDGFFRDILELRGEKVLFLYTEPEVLDFTDVKEFKLILTSNKKQVQFAVTEANLLEVTTALKECLFASELVICCWAIKNFLSAVLHWTKKPYLVQGKLLDLKIIEAYTGEKETKRPESYNVAVERLKIVLNKQNEWKEIYKKIHLPLIKEVVPEMENAGIINTRDRKLLYAHYEIEGQKNGRFNCSTVFKSGFNPHRLNPEEKTILKARGENRSLALFDFKCMEVSVLQWLSQDNKIREILETGEDFYKSVFNLLTGRVCEQDKHREFVKQVFLPVVFGMSAKTITEKFKVSEKFAKHIIDTLNAQFPSAMSFVEANQNQNKATDYLGRSRKFGDNCATKIRNFVIQSPAATVCFEKLIDLRNLLKKTTASLAFSIHDGYVLYVPSNKVEYITALVKENLERPSELLGGLKLRVACKIGPTLSSLEPYEVGKESNV